MKYKILTLFPEMVSNINHSILKKAQENDLISIDVVDFRKYSKLKWNRVDDIIFGGGPGMLIKPEPIIEAIVENKDEDTKVIMLAPEGKTFNNELAKDLAKEKSLMFVCGHYEGFDARVSKHIDMEISIGDFVLTNGELATSVCIDAISRFIPGVLGNANSYLEDSFENKNLLDYDKYTKPRDFEGDEVPEVLFSGNHKKIEYWRKYNQIEKTYRKRPDLIDESKFDQEELKILEEVKKNEN